MSFFWIRILVLQTELLIPFGSRDMTPFIVAFSSKYRTFRHSKLIKMAGLDNCEKAASFTNPSVKIRCGYQIAEEKTRRRQLRRRLVTS